MRSLLPPRDAGSGGEIQLEEEVIPIFKGYLMLTPPPLLLFHHCSCPLVN